mgnify:CR=1 FL=1
MQPILDIPQITEIGRFTIVKMKKDEIAGIGIARSGQGDTFSREIGIAIAQGRAEKAIELKKKGSRINHPYMG